MTTSVISSPWTSEFRSLLNEARVRLRIAAPFIKLPAVEFMYGVLGDPPRRGLQIQVLTRLAVPELLSGATDLEAIQALARLPMVHSIHVEIRALSNLHAKVYIVDDISALATSANLTPGGLMSNAELGIRVSEPIAVREVSNWFDAAWAAAKNVDPRDLDSFKDHLGSIRVRTIIEQPHSPQNVEVPRSPSAVMKTSRFLPRPADRAGFAAVRAAGSALLPTMAPSAERFTRLASDDPPYAAEELDLPGTIGEVLQPEPSLLLQGLLTGDIRIRRTARRHLRALARINPQALGDLAEALADAPHSEALDVLDRLLPDLDQGTATLISCATLRNPRLHLWQEGYRFLNRHDHDLATKILLEILREPRQPGVTPHVASLRKARALHRLVSLPFADLLSLDANRLLAELTTGADDVVMKAVRRARQRMRQKTRHEPTTGTPQALPSDEDPELT